MMRSLLGRAIVTSYRVALASGCPWRVSDSNSSVAVNDSVCAAWIVSELALRMSSALRSKGDLAGFAAAFGAGEDVTAAFAEVADHATAWDATRSAKTRDRMLI